MKARLFFFQVFIFFVSVSNAVALVNKDTACWIGNKSELKQVFVNHPNLRKTELLKLYSDQSFEFITYSNNNETWTMKRETGTYNLVNDKLSLCKSNGKKSSSPLFAKPLIFVSGKGIYTSKLKSILAKKDFIMKAENSDKFDFPFYLNPETETVVNNIDAHKKINLNDLIYHLTRHSKNEREKVNTIIGFIHRSIEYDHPGLKNNNYANEQCDTKSILAGKKRLAVCEGYSRVCVDLCIRAGIDCRYVLGYVKRDKRELETKGEYHAWNILRVNGKEELYDVTWADGNDREWMNVSPEVMIYSHFPDKETDQLLSTPICKSDFEKSVLVFPEKENALNNLIFPLQATCFTDSVFLFTIDKLVDEVRVKETPGDYFTVFYINESTSSVSNLSYRTITDFSLSHENGRTTIRIPLKYKISLLEVYANGSSYAYKVINGNQQTMFKEFQRMAKKTNVDSYVKGVIASIALNDSLTLKTLLGTYNKVFFTDEHHIKPELLAKLKDWKGDISHWEYAQILKVNYVIAGLATSTNENKVTENRIHVGNHYLVFEKINQDYNILAFR